MNEIHLKVISMADMQVNADSRRKGTYFDVGRVYTVHNKHGAGYKEILRNRYLLFSSI